MTDIASFLSGFKIFQRTYFCGDNELFNDLNQAQKPLSLIHI